VLQNPRCTGHQVRNRQRTDKDLADPADVSLGDKRVQRWNRPDGWVISREPAREALVSEAGYIAAQGVGAARGPAPLAEVGAPERRTYLLAGLLACGACGRRTETARANGWPAYRCRHGHTSASAPDPGRPKSAFIREDRVLPHLPALHLLLAGADGSQGQRRRRTRRGADARHHASPEDVIAGLRENNVTVTFDPAAGTLHADGAAAIQTVTRKQANPRPERAITRKEPGKKRRRSPGAGGSLRLTIFNSGGYRRV
jgi:hypothetical protein